MRGRNTTVVRVRVPDSVHAMLVEQANSKEMELGTYLRKLLTNFTGRLNSVDTTKKLELYNPAVNKAGDRVLVCRGKKLIETVVPELDADGNSIPLVL